MWNRSATSLGRHPELSPAPPWKLLEHALWTNLDEFSLNEGTEVSVAWPPWGAEGQSWLAPANPSPTQGLPIQL